MTRCSFAFVTTAAVLLGCTLWLPSPASAGWAGPRLVHSAGAWPARSVLAPVAPHGVEQDETLDVRLDKIAGIKPAAARAFLGELQRTVGVTDRLAACALIKYPLRHRDGPVADALACQRRYAEIFTADVIDAIRSQDFEKLFVNAQGVMLGDGQVWFAAVCLDRSCAQSELRVTAVNPPTPTNQPIVRPR